MNRFGLTGARFSMRATVLRPADPEGVEVDPNATGQWVNRQDPLTGEIIRVWEPVPPADGPVPIPTKDPLSQDIWCIARGINEGGIRAAATTENFDELYVNVDIIQLWTPPRYTLTKRDRITNVRTKDGTILWRDEESENGDIRATVFNINGVIPGLDAFNRHIENFCLLERAEV